MKLTVAINIGNALLAALILLKLPVLLPEPAPVAPPAVQYVLVRYEPASRPLVTCLDIVKKWEGYRKHAYKGKDKTWTVGLGWTRGVREGDTMGYDRAVSLASQRCAANRAAIAQALTAPVSEQRLEVLASLAYNAGQTAVKTSTLVRHLNNGRDDLAAEELPRWRFIGKTPIQGLLNRRLYERALFVG